MEKNDLDATFPLPLFETHLFTNRHNTSKIAFRSTTTQVERDDTNHRASILKLDPSITHSTNLSLELTFHEQCPAPSQPRVNPFHNPLTRFPSSMQDNTKAANQLTKNPVPLLPKRPLSEYLSDQSYRRDFSSVVVFLFICPRAILVRCNRFVTIRFVERRVLGMR